eukprot:gene10217-9696_t
MSSWGEQHQRAMTHHVMPAWRLARPNLKVFIAGGGGLIGAAPHAAPWHASIIHPAPQPPSRPAAQPASQPG